LFAYFMPLLYVLGMTTGLWKSGIWVDLPFSFAIVLQFLCCRAFVPELGLRVSSSSRLERRYFSVKVT
jgi:hypothetical protein